MRLVDRPYCRPMHCAALPHIGQTTRTRWIDTGSELDGFDNHVYLSEQAVTQAATLIGWVPGGELRSAQAEIKRLELEHARLRADLATTRGLLEQTAAFQAYASPAQGDPVPA